MDCRSTRQLLDESIAIGGMFLEPELHEHLETCPDCRAYHDQLMELAGAFQPLDELTMTADEERRFDEQLRKAMAESAAAAPTTGREKKLFSFARVALAAAVVLALALASYRPAPVVDTAAVTERFEQMPLPQTTAQEVMPLLLVNGDSDLLPSPIDQTSASYLTGQVPAGQAADILESISTEEYEWLKENLTVEM